MKHTWSLLSNPDRILFHVHISQGLKDRLKQVAWEQRRTLRDVVIEAFEKWLSWQASIKADDEKKG